jgi:hypothetical protein
MQTLLASDTADAGAGPARKPNGDRKWGSYILNLTFDAQFAGVHKCPGQRFWASWSAPFSGWSALTLFGAKPAAAVSICSHRGRGFIVRNRHRSEAAIGIQDFPCPPTVNKGWMRLSYSDRFRGGVRVWSCLPRNEIFRIFSAATSHWCQATDCFPGNCLGWPSEERLPDVTNFDECLYYVLNDKCGSASE